MDLWLISLSVRVCVTLSVLHCAYLLHWYLERDKIKNQNYPGQNNFLTRIPLQGHHVIWYDGIGGGEGTKMAPLDDIKIPPIKMCKKWLITMTASQTPIAALYPPGKKMVNSLSQWSEEQLLKRPVIHGYVVWQNLYPPSPGKDKRTSVWWQCQSGSRSG